MHHAEIIAVYFLLVTSSHSFSLRFTARSLRPRALYAAAEEYFYVTPEGLNIQVLSTQPEVDPVFVSSAPAREIQASTPKKMGKLEKWLDTLWGESGWFADKSEPTDAADLGSPIIFIHGSFHAAWCFAEHFFRYFSEPSVDERSRAHACYSLSLRGTSGETFYPRFG